MSLFTPNVKSFFGVNFLASRHDTFFKSISEDAMKHHDKSSALRKNFMQILLRLGKNRSQDEKPSDEQDDGLTMQEVITHASLTFGASIDSPSLAITFLMFEITKNPHVQERLIEEIDRVLGKHNGEVTWDSISEMKYVEMVLDGEISSYNSIIDLYNFIHI